MVICPKCSQPSENEKICSNCWADLKARPASSKPKRDLTEMPLKNIITWAVMLTAFGIFLAYMSQMLVQMAKGEKDASDNSKSTIPMVMPTVTPADISLNSTVATPTEQSK